MPVSFLALVVNDENILAVYLSWILPIVISLRVAGNAQKVDQTLLERKIQIFFCSSIASSIFFSFRFSLLKK